VVLYREAGSLLADPLGLLLFHCRSSKEWSVRL
jgi:hypothetical protein